MLGHLPVRPRPAGDELRGGKELDNKSKNGTATDDTAWMEFVTRRQEKMMLELLREQVADMRRYDTKILVLVAIAFFGLGVFAASIMQFVSCTF